MTKKINRINKGIFFLLTVILFFPCKGQIQTGIASYYSDNYEGKITSSGEKYKSDKFTAAHRMFPYGTVVEVKNVANNRSVEVTINDRGPFVKGRIIDLSQAAAKKIGLINAGLTIVALRIVKEVVIQKNVNHPPENAVLTIEKKEFYSLSVARVPLHGRFGIQVGTYKETANLIRLTARIQRTYSKRIVVQIKTINGIKYYAIMLSPFASKKVAHHFLEGLLKDFPDAFVIDFSRLR